MMSLPIIEDEADRLASLQSIGILDTPFEAEFDELVELAAWTCHAPMSAISLIDLERQWFKAETGIGLDETAREIAFCAHTVAEGQTVICPDTQLDPRFRDNPFVTGEPEVRFYAAVPLSIDGGHHVGTLCVFDTRPRTLFSDERRALEIIARQVEAKLYTRRLEWNSVDAVTGVHGPIAAKRWIASRSTDLHRAAVHFDIGALDALDPGERETSGHVILAAASARLRDNAPDGALIARIGNDFVLLLDGYDSAGLHEQIDTLRAALAAPHETELDISVGLATARPGDDAGDLIEAAAQATALEKQLRRDR